MKRSVFLSLLAVSLLTLLLTAGVLIAALREEFTSEKKNELRSEAGYLLKAYELSGPEVLSASGSVNSTRITLIDGSGTVLYDSLTDAASLENHGERPEFIAAEKTGVGESTRSSDTFGENTYYYALRTSDGSVLRVSATLRSIARLLDSTFGYIALIIAAVAVIAVFASKLITGRIVAPVNAIDPEHPLDCPAYDELSPLLVKMDRQNRTIAEQIRELSSKQRELDQITDQMSEALVIFGSDRHILSANRSARGLFSGYRGAGTSYLELCRDLTYIRAVEGAFEGSASEGKLSFAGRVYRLSVNPVAPNLESRDESGASPKYAAVLFAADITESEAAENSRREFSANVSHELKTPLTSILGYAEIMKDGIAAQKDFPRFIGMIYDEAGRLLRLIEDIIRLSRLDESGANGSRTGGAATGGGTSYDGGTSYGEFAPVGLLTVSEKVAEELRSKAERFHVTIETDGEETTVSGIENLLHEMIFNLADNAISYNRPGGTVKITVGKHNEAPYIRVRDDGIGISPEDQSRVFERFYRVDKSRSKANGAGTGLGLSIVKHGARLHGASVALESELGRGTEITLSFKKNAAE